MEHVSHHPPAPFTAPERDLLRRELCRHFGQDPVIADGIFLRTWRAGERKGQPKIPPAVQSMLERGLVEVRAGQRGPRAFFTDAGLAPYASSCWIAAPWTRSDLGICRPSWV
jgi:hypothetical protein